MFTWIPIHREAIHRILEHRQNEKELLTVLREMEQRGLKVISLQDEGADGQKIPLAEIDPFTFLASFNRGVTEKNRQENWNFLKTHWGLKAPVPDDFSGIPTVNNMRSWLFPYATKREKDHVGHLWQVASLAADGSIEQVGQEVLDRCLELKFVGFASLTIGLFWINPEKFLPADRKTTAYGKAKGISTEPEDYQSYRQWMKEMSESLGQNYPQISHAAHLFAVQGKSWNFTKWMGPLVDALRALGGSGTPKTVLQKIQELLKLPDAGLADMNKSGQTRFYNEVAWARKYLVWEGLIESTKRGIWTLTQKGTQTVLDEKKAQVIAEKWAAVHKQSAEEGPEDDITQLQEVDTPPPSTGVAYWWLNANPKIWNFEETSVGQSETYTSHSDKGNKRRIYERFREVKAGDVVVGYVASPQKEIVAVCRIIKGLHQTKDGEKIEFEKTEQLAAPISYETLQATPDLAKSEPFTNNLQGSLFKLTEQEYEIIRSLIDETNIPAKIDIELYDKEKAMKGLFLAKVQFDEMLYALREKKNVVLQGAPGVGKTYVAKRLAYALTESNDPQRIETIQFHQSYSYEDFIQGFRPTPKGHFDLKYGIFHQFCRRAQRAESTHKPYVFIIDEINRGNLSKIFGELMMLIEPDKRGKEHAIPLAYSQDADERFYIPENLYLIGMMNTADRSLAMVDYALRRRFRFITLRPEFASEAFRDFLADVGAKPELAKKIVARMNALNEVIAADTKNLGPGYQIGHSYFCPRNSINPDEDWYCRVIEAEIVPLIQEYWFDNEQKVKEQRSALLA
jgi:5-methylcytosine-specific restriction protein B